MSRNDDFNIMDLTESLEKNTEELIREVETESHGERTSRTDMYGAGRSGLNTDMYGTGRSGLDTDVYGTGRRQQNIDMYENNRSDLDTHYNVGKILSEAGSHYGEGIINEYSKRLTNDLGKGYSKRNLWLMLRFYEFKEKMQTVSAQLSWSHYCELLSFENFDKINYYVELTKSNNLSVRKLRNRIKSSEYERLPESTRNKIISNEESNIIDFVKNPIRIKNNNNYEIYDTQKYMSTSYKLYFGGIL